MSVEKNNFDVLFLMALQWIPLSAQENIEKPNFIPLPKMSFIRLKKIQMSKLTLTTLRH
ncbi:hypothetical protein [Pseudoalteromonas arctica]|uniref:hypothetical protein n=1 Tax=Pseudoalteromonas arctica TaxID=394751 RepID=UPI001CEC49DB|nr:hypothetical protein [Pseudoalteromonas arctica]